MNHKKLNKKCYLINLMLFKKTNTKVTKEKVIRNYSSFFLRSILSRRPCPSK